MKLFGKIINPLIALIAIQLAWVLVVLVWIRWFLGSQEKLRALAQRYSPELLQSNVDWFLLVEGLVLLILILAGVYVIFLYWRKQVALYREQKKFIAQVTHELKSPLASIQLYLETIRMRHPSPDKLERFVDTMLADTHRLHGLINNLLTANRMELKGPRLALKEGDLSSFVEEYFSGYRKYLPEGSNLELSIAPRLFSRFEAESLETVFRNLMENAVLYSTGNAQIMVDLRDENGHCHLKIADRGRGLEDHELKKIFRMFYRSKRGVDRTSGTGLGLFIARAIVLRHRGKIWAESSGPGKGTTIHITLPCIKEPDEFADS